jgi:type II secretory pathway pseudopilin PulG
MTASRARSEAGFTLIELLAGMAIAMVIVLAAFTLMDNSMQLTLHTQSRVDAQSRGRTALDTMVRELRSQVCLDKAPPIVEARWSGDRQILTFYADFSDGSGTVPPQRRVLTYDISDATITESVFDGTGTPPATTYTQPPRVTTLLDDVAPSPDVAPDSSGNRPVFRFYRFDTSPKPLWVGPLNVPLVDADRIAVTKVGIAFGVRGSGAPAADQPLAVLQDDVFVRSADPNLTSPTPTCA